MRQWLAACTDSYMFAKENDFSSADTMNSSIIAGNCSVILIIKSVYST